jgi:hypothetical protein
MSLAIRFDSQVTASDRHPAPRRAIRKNLSPGVTLRKIAFAFPSAPDFRPAQGSGLHQMPLFALHEDLRCSLKIKYRVDCRSTPELG